MERVRTPDEQFPSVLRTLAIVLPIAFGLLMIPFLLLPLVTEAFLGPQSALTRGLDIVSSYLWKFIMCVFVITFFGMYGLRAYVYWNLRRQKKPE